MAMNDEETVALIAGGHTFGKTHGAADPDEYVGAEPEGAPLEEQGLGWRNGYGTGKGADTITSGLEVTWTTTPDAVVERASSTTCSASSGSSTKSPAGAHQWQPKDGAGAGTVPGPDEGSPMRPPDDAHDRPRAALRPDYEPISRRFHEHPDELADAFARAWFKLTHRDMGPIERYLGPEVPDESCSGRTRSPRRPTSSSAEDVAALKAQILDSGLSVSELVKAAWASASTFRGSDKRGGANGARIRLEPQKGWEVNDPDELAQGPADPGGHPAVVRQAGLAGRPDRARRLRGRGAGGEGRRRRGRGPVHAGARGRVGRSRPTRSRSTRSSRRRTAFATTSAAITA